MAGGLVSVVTSWDNVNIINKPGIVMFSLTDILFWWDKNYIKGTAYNNSEFQM